MTLPFGKLTQALTDYSKVRAQGVVGAALSAAEKHFLSEVNRCVLILVYIGLGACSSCSFFRSSSTISLIFFLLQAPQRLSTCSCGCVAARLLRGAFAKRSKSLPSFLVSSLLSLLSPSSSETDGPPSSHTHSLAAVLRQNMAFFDAVGAGEITNRIEVDTLLVQEGFSEKVVSILSFLLRFT
jgi:hypothetical protein